MPSGTPAPSPRPAPTTDRGSSSTRYNTKSRPPPRLDTVARALIDGQGPHGYASTKSVDAVIRGAVRTVYDNSAACELRQFLQQYGVLVRGDRFFTVIEPRFTVLREACVQGKELAFDFPTPAANSGNGAVKPVNRTVLIPKRSAYFTEEELEALTIIDAGMEETVVGGEFRVPNHTDPEVFAKSAIGQLFGKHHGVFARLLARFVGGGILRKVPHTGPGGDYDAYAFVVPLKEIRVFLIDERIPTAVPSFVLDIISRVLDLENLEFIQGESASATVRRATITRLTNRGMRGVEGLVDIFSPWMTQYRQDNPAEGWGLVLQASGGAEVLVCFPGFGPVQFVEENIPLRRQMVPGMVEAKVAAKPVQQAPPRILTVADVTEEMDEVTLARILQDTPPLLEAAQAEKERRDGVAQKAARRAELEQRLEASRASATARDEEATRIAEAARVAREAAAAAEVELLALKAELDALV